MKIVILGAMDEEIALLQGALENSQTLQHQHLSCHVGELHGHEIMLAKCGIGKVAASLGTSLLIDKFAPDYVINTGSAGGFDQDLDVGDVVIATHVKHHDVDITHFGYALGQCAGQPPHYDCSEDLIKAAQLAADTLNDIKSKQGLICTGDSFVGSDEAAQVIRTNFADIAAVEMEAAAIAQTSHMLNTPFLVIRSLSDIAGKTSSVSFDAYLEKAAKNSAQLVMGTISQL